MTKATHRGTCQCCGSFQKLPNDKLSNHGYTKELGFFVGTCMGAGWSPFEISTGLIELCIEKAVEMLDALKVELATPPMMVTVFDPAIRTHANRGYRTVAVVSFEKRDDLSRYNTHVAISANGDEWPVQQESYSYSETLEALAKKKGLKITSDRVAEIKSYIEWQQDRVKGWKPGELTPV